MRDPHCFANLLRFYDGICQWEEGSHTPILHIGWSKQLCFSISKFDYDIRSQVKIIIKSDFNDDDDDNNNKKNESSTESDLRKTIDSNKEDLLSIKSPSSNSDTKNEFPMLPSLDELTAACGEKILNPDFLLHGGGVPFTEPTSDDSEGKTNGILEKKDFQKESTKVETTTNASNKVSKPEDKVLSPIQKDMASPQSSASPQLASPLTTVFTDDTKSELVKSEEEQSNDTNNNGKAETFDDFDLHAPKRPTIILKSRKMKGLKDLLLAEKLNTNAISLQITAQSHIGNKKSRSSLGGDDSNVDGSRPKRTRRE